MKNAMMIAIFCTVLLTGPAALADEPAVELDEIVVTGKTLIKPTKQTSETVYTGSEITKEGIEAQGTKAGVSVYEAVNVLPGVSVEGVDPYGLGAEQKNIRIRGVRGYLGAMTVEGVPSWGGNPMGPREYLYDTENFDSIAVYKGAVPADLGTGVGARGGAMELRPRWPEKTPGVDFKQGLGENNYTRTFLRLDSGKIPTVGTRLSVSGSYADADKWKGPGDLGPRKNAAIMVSQPITEKDEIYFYFNYNDLSQDLYKPLTYTEVGDLGDNYDNDYNQHLTGTASEDINYYKYNRGDYLNRDFLSVIPYTFSDIFSIKLKPYYSDEDSKILEGVASKGGSVQKRIRDIERSGLISQIESRFSWATASLGYWVESSDMSIRTQFYDVESLDFKGYGMYMDNDGNGIVHSPYVRLAGRTGKFDWQAGLKYFYYKEPESQGYTAAPPKYELVKSPDLYRSEETYDQLLPTVGIRCRLADQMELYTSYGRNQIRPYAYLPLINVYNTYRSDFQAAGITLDDLFGGYDMEVSDNFEVGARLQNPWMEFRPALFYSKHKDLLTTVYDPRVGEKGVNYYQNVGDATGYGVELEANFFFGEHLTFFLNPTYTILTYDDDLTYAGATLNTKNNQVVDTPEWMVKSGLIFTWGGFEVIPMVRYLDSRYGDAENKEKIDDYTVVDLKLGYTKKELAFVDALKISLEFINLFNDEYVSYINAMDDSRAGATSYYVGAPFTTMLTVSLEM